MLVWTVKAVLLQSLALVICAGLRHRAAVTRRGVLICSVVAVCALPLVGLVGPGLAAGELAEALNLNTVSASAAPATTLAAKQQAPGARAEVDGLAVGATSQLPLILTAVWLLGVALLMIRWAVGLVRTGRLRRSGSPVADDRWLSMVARLTTRPVKLLWSRRITSPMTVGVIDPVIVLPGEAGTWPESKAAMAIAHEVAHIRRGDTLWIHVSLLLRALQWANPVAWWVHRQLRLEIERSADEEVVASGAPAGRYAALLLDLASRSRPVAELAMARPSGIERRLRSLASIASRTKASPASRGIGLIVLGLGFGLGCLQTDGPQDSAETSSRLELGDWQGAVNATAQRLRVDHPGSDVRIGVMRVDTGALIASAGALDEPFGSGSTIKPLTVAAALQEGVAASTVLDCSKGTIASGGKVYRDHTRHGKLTVTAVLARSSNVGTVQLLDRLQPQRLFAWLQKLGVATAGRVDRADPAGAATGISLDLSVRELLTAYATIANKGASPTTGDQIIAPKTARAVLGMLTAAVSHPLATGRRARVDGTTVAGKTGTMDRPGSRGGRSRRTATFVGLVPAARPRWAIAVAVAASVDGPRSRKFFGGSVAAPAFARIVRKAGRP